MGIFSRFKTVVSSNINDLIAKAENPEKMLNQLLLDMNQQMVESKKSVAMAIADEKKIERELLEQKRLGEDWEKKAMLAVRAGRDDLAKEALLRKQEYEGYFGQLKPQWEAQKASVEKLKESLRQLQNKIDEASRKKNILIARAKRAEAQEKIQKTLTTMSGNSSAFDTFDRMAKKVDELEARAEAATELEDLSKDSFPRQAIRPAGILRRERGSSPGGTEGQDAHRGCRHEELSRRAGPDRRSRAIAHSKGRGALKAPSPFSFPWTFRVPRTYDLLVLPAELLLSRPDIFGRGIPPDRVRTRGPVHGRPGGRLFRLPARTVAPGRAGSPRPAILETSIRPRGGCLPLFDGTAGGRLGLPSSAGG